MSLYVLDTDILTLLQDGDPIVRQRVGSHPKSGAGKSSPWSEPVSPWKTKPPQKWWWI